MKYKCSCGKPTDNETFISENLILHTCDECKEQIHKEVEFQSEGEQWREDTIICPFCKYHFEAYDCYEYEVGEHSKIECPACDGKFDLEVEDIRYFSTKKSLCEMNKSEVDSE